MTCSSTDLKCYNGYAVDMGFLYTFNIAMGEDVTGRTFHFDVKEKSDSAGYLFQLTNVLSATDTGIYVSDAVAGDLVLRINSADSDGVTTPGSKPYEFWYELAGEKYMVFQGSIEFIQGALA